MSFNIPSTIRVDIPADATGLIGRECPNADCKGYFKIQPGTGLKGDGLPCHCPYCGNAGAMDDFTTQEQLEYVESVGLRHISDAAVRELKKFEFNHSPRGLLGIGISLKVKHEPLPPIRHYRERKLETDIVCTNCTLRYAIYGVFAFCPDCGTHNSLQILKKNLELAEKELVLAAEMESPEMQDYLIGDALENAVAAFDGFGRELARVNSARAFDPHQAECVSFQNIHRADNQLHELFGVRLTAAVDAECWRMLIRCFQKRHLLSHRMGVVDETYMTATNDPEAVLGRKIRISAEEVKGLVQAVLVLGNFLSSAMGR